MDLYSKSSGIDNLRDAFPADVLRQAAVASGIRPSSLLSKRLDLRGKTILSFGEIEDKHPGGLIISKLFLCLVLLPTTQ